MGIGASIFLIAVHGDTLGAATIAWRVRAALVEADAELQRFAPDG